MRRFGRLRTAPEFEERHPERGVHDPWIYSTYERHKSAVATAVAFALSFFAILVTGVALLAVVPTADTNLLDLKDRLDRVQCVRVARRADYTIAFVSVGSPAQYLKLLLVIGSSVPRDSYPAMSLFTERMHKSQTMECQPFDLPIPTPYQEDCHDAAMIFDGTDNQIHIQTRFVYSNRIVAASRSDRAELLGLDGSLTLIHGRTYWLTSTHLCWENDAIDLQGMPFSYHVNTLWTPSPTPPPSPPPPSPPPDGPGAPPAVPARPPPSPLAAFPSKAHVRLADLVDFAPFAKFPAARSRGAPDCDRLADDDPVVVELFPEEASEEMEHWLALTNTFLYEYGQSILERRREVVEVGPACAEARESLTRAHDIYRLDCHMHYPEICRATPSVPFRRVSEDRIRISIDEGGSAELHVERTLALARIPHLLSYSDGLLQALGRLLIMLLTAAVVFVRGNQNASSSTYMLERALNTVRCRNRNANSVKVGSEKKVYKDIDVSLEHSKTEIGIDGLITVTALGSRIAVLAANWNDFLADGVGHVNVFEVIGIAVSFFHVLLRAGAFEIDLERESPLTKLAGPMSICDVSSAVLLVFADPPLLTTHDGRFAAVGRMLIAILISISVFSRCAFAVAICALLASSAKNSSTIYDELGKGRFGFRYQSVLVVSSILWAAQAIACCATLCILFVQPAAYSMIRMQPGDTTPVRYCIFFGLLTAALPTVTKVALRVFESECAAEEKAHAD